MPDRIWSRTGALAAAALALSACATPAPEAVIARDETGVVVVARPIVVTNALPEPQTVPQPAAAGAPLAGADSAAAVGVTPQIPGPTVSVAVIADSVQPGETRQGTSYTIRRDRDGTLMEVAQPELQALAPGTRVHLSYGARVRITPAG
jgi:hypothetical protein